MYTTELPYTTLQQRSFSVGTKDNKNSKISWRQIYNMIDEPENRKKPIMKRLKGIKDQAVKLGGKRVIIFHTAVFFGFWGLFYIILKNGVLEIDTLVELMGRYSFSSKFTGMVANYPNASYLIISSFGVDLVDPIRLLMSFWYMGRVVRKRYLEIALDNIETENSSIQKAIESVKTTDLSEEEEKNPKLKTARIITIKGKNNSSINM